MGGSRRSLLVALGLVLAALLTFAPTLDEPYAEDDHLFLEAVTRPDAPRALSYLWREGVMDHHRRPISDPWFFALTTAIAGTDPWAYHVILLLLHVVAALLVRGIARGVTGSELSGTIAGVLFVTRDLVFPSLVWGSGVSDIAGTTLVLGALAVLARAGPGSRVAAACLMVAALAAKETAVVGIGLAGLLAAHARHRAGAGAREMVGAAARQTWPIVAFAVPFALLQLATVRFEEAGGRALYALEPGLHALRVWPAYLVWCVGGVRELYDAPAYGAFAAAAHALAGVCVLLAVRAVRRARSGTGALGILAFAWFLVAISPALLAPNRVLTNYAALACVGPLVFVAHLLSGGLSRPRTRWISFATGVLLCFSGALFVRAKDGGFLRSGGWVNVANARTLTAVTRAIAGGAGEWPANARVLVFGAMSYDVRVLGDPRGRGFGPQQVFASAVRVASGRADVEVLSLPPIEACPPDALAAITALVREAPERARMYDAPSVPPRDVTERAVAAIRSGAEPSELRRVLVVPW